MFCQYFVIPGTGLYNVWGQKSSKINYFFLDDRLYLFKEIIDSRGNVPPKNGCEHKFWFVIFIEKK